MSKPKTILKEIFFIYLIWCYEVINRKINVYEECCCQ